MNVDQIINKCVELKDKRGDFDEFLDDNKTAKTTFKRILLDMYKDGELTKTMAYRRYLELKEQMERL